MSTAVDDQVLGFPGSIADLGWIKLGYHDIHHGAGAAADTAAVVLLHGAGAGATSVSNFGSNIPALAQHYRVIALDLPGFGRSDAYVMTTEARTTVSARAVVGLVEELGIARAHLVGNSLGAGVAMTVAVDHPERVDRLVLMGARGVGAPLFATEPTEGIKALQAAYRDQSMSTFRAFFDLMLYDGSTVSDETLRRRAESVRQEQLDAWIASYASPLRSLAGSLRDVAAPTLLLHGRNDRVVPFEGSLNLLAELPNSELHAFNRCGHWVQYEQAERFNELVIGFLGRS